MQQPVSVNETFSVGRDQPRPGEIGAIADHGYRSLVNLRAAGEDGQTMTPDEEAAEARAAGLSYLHLPVRSDRLAEEDVDEFRRMVSDLPAPVFVHCASGKRSGAMTLMHVGVESGMSGQEVLDRARSLGFDWDTAGIQELVRRYVDARRSH
jgi:uncharacterized protein (TIGR01244 family)